MARTRSAQTRPRLDSCKSHDRRHHPRPARRRLPRRDPCPTTPPARLIAAFRAAPYEDLGFARVDHHRAVRQGQPEVVFGLGKSTSQVVEIARRIAGRGHALLVTRATPDMGAAVSADLTDCRFDAVSRTIVRPAAIRPGLGAPKPGGDTAAKAGPVLVCCAGTSDLPVAEEAAVCAEAMGLAVGAPLRRRRRRHPPPAGRTEPPGGGARPDRGGGDGRRPAQRGRRPDRAPVIAVPTSVGYGASFDGLAALLAMLNSCASRHRGHEHRQRIRGRRPCGAHPPPRRRSSTGGPSARRERLQSAVRQRGPPAGNVVLQSAVALPGRPASRAPPTSHASRHPPGARVLPCPRGAGELRADASRRRARRRARRRSGTAPPSRPPWPRRRKASTSSTATRPSRCGRRRTSPTPSPTSPSPDGPLEPLRLLGLADALDSIDQVRTVIRREPRQALPRLGDPRRRPGLLRDRDPRGAQGDRRRRRGGRRRQPRAARDPRPAAPPARASCGRRSKASCAAATPPSTCRNRSSPTARAATCVVVKSEHRHAIPGLIHGSSASGASLYLEPLGDRRDQQRADRAERGGEGRGLPDPHGADQRLPAARRGAGARPSTPRRRWTSSRPRRGSPPPAAPARPALVDRRPPRADRRPPSAADSGGRLAHPRRGRHPRRPRSRAGRRRHQADPADARAGHHRPEHRRQDGGAEDRRRCWR